MILLELLLAGFLRCAGLPAADLEFMTDTLCCVLALRNWRSLPAEGERK